MGRPSLVVASFAVLAASAGIAGSHEDLQVQIERLTKQIEREPGRALLHFRRGELRRMHDDWDEARRDLERAGTLDPELEAAQLALGRLENRCGNWERAKAALDRFLSRRPEHGEALLERARARFRLGERTDAAADHSRGLLRLEEPRPENYLELAEELRSDGRLDEARRQLEAGVRRVGPALPLQLALLDLDVETRRTDAALSRLEEIALASERKDLWQVRRGEILQGAGRAAEARAAYRSALASIEALPPARRKTRFTQDLERRSRTALEALHEHP